MANNMIIWINENKEWFFSGIGITFMTVVWNFVRKKRDDNKNGEMKIKQVNYGKNNTQIGIQNNYYNEEEKNNK